MLSQSSQHNSPKTTSSSFLKNLLEYKQKAKSNSSSKQTSISSFQRDISHIADSFRYKTFQQQIKEKQEIAEQRLNDYVLHQKKRKQINEYLNQNAKTILKEFNKEDPFDNVIQILDKYADYNLNWTSQDFQEVSKDRKSTMNNIKATIQNGIEKGYFETPINLTSERKITNLKIIKEMKHTSTHFFSNEPTGRYDAINLKKWIQNHLESIQQNKQLDSKEKLVQASDSLFVCLNELIRQVSYQCVERGQLMLAIFKGYIMMFKKTINMSEYDKKQQKIESFKNEIELKIGFDELIEEKEITIRQLRIKIEELNERILSFQNDEQNLLNSIQKLSKQSDVDKTLKKSAVLHIVSLNREIKELRNKIQKIQYLKPLMKEVIPKEEEVEEQDLSLSQILREVESKTQVEQNPDIVVKDIIDEPPQITFSVYCQTQVEVQEKDIQTNLQFIASYYDKILDQQELEQYYKEYQIKEQMGFIVGEDPIPPNTIPNNPYLQQKASLLRILDGLPGNLDAVKNMKKEDMFDLFIQNMKTLRDFFDREEELQIKQQQSDSEQSIQIEPPDLSDEKISQYKESRNINTCQYIAEAPEFDEASPNPKEISNIPSFSLKKLSIIETQNYQNNNNKSNNQLQFVYDNQQQTSQRQNQQQPKSSKRNLEKMFSSDKLALPAVKEIQTQELTKTQIINNQTQQNSTVQLQPVQNSNASLIQSSNLNISTNQPLSSKFGLVKQEQIQLKTQIAMMMMLYNLQVQKTQNQTKSMNDLASLLNQQFIFTRKLMLHILRTQLQTHKQIAESFLVEFDVLRKRLPIELDAEIQEDEYIQTEFDEEEEKEKKKQIQFKKRKNRITKALQFNFQQKQNKVNVIDRLLHPGVILAVKAKEQSYLFKKVVNYWPLKNVLRTITQLYDEKIRSGKDNETQKDMEMQIFVFNNFLNRYGFKNVAEKKYLQFLVSIIHFCSYFRVHVFARMMAIVQEETQNFSVEESQFFLQGYDFMNSESSLGVNVIQSESEQKFHVPYLRALDFMKVFLENKLIDEELRELRNDLENMKEQDPKNMNKQGLIDVDIFLVKVMQKYRGVLTRTKEFVISAFQAADLDGNKKINNNEFITLFRHIEHQKFNFKEAMNLFDDQADIIQGDERNLSFNRFTSVCVNQQIFTNQALNNFINVKSNEDIDKQFLLIKSEWPNYKQEIEKTLMELQPYVTSEIFTDWKTILKTLEQRINQKSEQNQIKPILIAHKILKLELERLLKVGHQEDDIDENAINQ